LVAVTKPCLPFDFNPLLKLCLMVVARGGSYRLGCWSSGLPFTFFAQTRACFQGILQGCDGALAIQLRPGAPATGQLFGMTPHQEQVIASEPYSGAWQVMAERQETP
jgi:hypothetical protein